MANWFELHVCSIRQPVHSIVIVRWLLHYSKCVFWVCWRAEWRQCLTLSWIQMQINSGKKFLQLFVRNFYWQMLKNLSETMTRVWMLSQSILKYFWITGCFFKYFFTTRDPAGKKKCKQLCRQMRRFNRIKKEWRYKILKEKRHLLEVVIFFIDAFLQSWGLERSLVCMRLMLYACSFFYSPEWSIQHVSNTKKSKPSSSSSSLSRNILKDICFLLKLIHCLRLLRKKKNMWISKVKTNGSL